VVLITRDQPRPIVMFASDDAPENHSTSRTCGRVGVHRGRLDPTRVKSIVDVAVARFGEHQRLRTELADANLNSRSESWSSVQGILMKARGMDENRRFRRCVAWRWIAANA